MAEPVRTLSFKTPKQALLVVIKAGIAKSKETVAETSLLAFMAGAYIAIGGLLSIYVAGGMSGEYTSTQYAADGVTVDSIIHSPRIGEANPGLRSLVAGAVFPVGLMLVVVAGASLFTGNIMYMTAAFLEKKVSLRDLGRSWVISFFGNWVGALAVAFFLCYLTDITAADPVKKYLVGLADKKMSLGWGVALLRGIGCNWMVCIGLWFGIASDDMMGKICALWWPIFTFVAIGFEHSIANMFFVSLGIFEGTTHHYGDFIGRNLIPVTIGNIIGGALFVATAQWLIYGRHFGEDVKVLDTLPGAHRRETPKAGAANPSIDVSNSTPVNALTPQVILELPSITK